MQIYSVVEPVYGPLAYTTVPKKLPFEIPEKEMTGSGREDSNNFSSDVTDEKSVLDQLNESTKNKLSPAIYSSFLKAQPLETGSVTIERKRRPQNPIAGNGPEKKIKIEADKLKHKFQFT